jgi:hypothetical protein
MQYISVEHQKAIGQRYRTAAMLVFAHCATVIMLIVVARFIVPPEVAPGGERLTRIIQTVVIVLALGVIVFRRVWMARVIMGSALRLGVGAALNRLVQMTVICAAISEVVAIVGFVFYLLRGDYQYALILSAVSLMLLFYTAFPRRGEWERAVAGSADAQTRIEDRGSRIED